MPSSRQRIEEEDICLAVPEEQSLERQRVLQQAAPMAAAAEAEGSLLNHRQEAESKLQMSKSLNNSPFQWHTSRASWNTTTWGASVQMPKTIEDIEFKLPIQEVRPFDKWDLRKSKRFSSTIEMANWMKAQTEKKTKKSLLCKYLTGDLHLKYTMNF